MQEVFCDSSRLQRMLDVIAALARAEARVGVIPSTAVASIVASCREEFFDVGDLARETAFAGNVAIPLVKALTARIASDDPAAAGFAYWGATSQDIVDTGLVLQLREALALMDDRTSRLAEALVALAESHKATILAGRTWMQQALPVTLGLKAAGWLSAIDRHRDRLRELRSRLLVLQFGGAAGTLAALGDDGMEVAAALAEELGLALPDSPWHTQRDRVAEAATVLGLLVGSLGKIARDVSLLMQSEIGEAFEPREPGRGGSSSMPHKQNPIGCAVTLAAATEVPALVSTMLGAMVQEHERGLGGWHAEWETLPRIFELTSGALAHTIDVLTGLDVDAERMRANLETTDGLIFAEGVTMALARHSGRANAHALVESACRRALEQGRHLSDVLLSDPAVSENLTSEEIVACFDPTRYLGSAQRIVENVLAQHRRTNRKATTTSS